MSDVISTVYELVDHYSGPLGSLVEMTGAFAASVARVTALLASAGATAFTEFTKVAIEQDTKIERLTYTYGALAGSMDVAKDKMRYLQDFAKTSLAHFDDLAESGTILEAAGLRMERFIPIINNVAGAFGASSDHVRELTEAIARMASGKLGESERIFRRFGITLADFANAGIDVGEGGKVTASAEQLLGALEKITQQKFGNIGSMMQDTMAVRFSNLGDAWNKMLERFGAGWMPFIKEVLAGLTPFMEFISSSGWMEQLGQAWADTIKSLTGMDSEGGGLPRFLSYVAAVLEELPGMFKSVGTFMKGFLQESADLFVKFVNAQILTWVTLGNVIKNQIDSYINHFIDAVSIMTHLAGAALGQPGVGMDFQHVHHQDFSFTPFQGPFDLFKRAFQGIGDAFGAMQMDVGEKANRIYDRFLNRDKSKSSAAGDVPMFNALYKPMQDTADNTEEIAKNTSDFTQMLKRYVVGGGPLAAIGVTPSELGALRGGGRGGGSTIHVNVGNRKLSDAITEIVEKTIQEGSRQGLWAGIN